MNAPHFNSTRHDWRQSRHWPDIWVCRNPGCEAYVDWAYLRDYVHPYPAGRDLGYGLLNLVGCPDELLIDASVITGRREEQLKFEMSTLMRMVKGHGFRKCYACGSIDLKPPRWKREVRRQGNWVYYEHYTRPNASFRCGRCNRALG